MEDATLYAAWVDGDKQAGSRLLERHLAAVMRFFANKVERSTDADDLAAETFELCARSLGSFRGDGSFRSYLFGVATNVLRGYLGRKLPKLGRERELGSLSLVDLGPSPLSVVGGRKQQTLLLQALRSIPLDCQIVLELGYFEELSRREIAQVLGVAEGTVASRIRIGRERLKEAMTGLAESPELLRSTLSGLEDWARSLKMVAVGPRSAPLSGR